jgi:hypothetical protein
MKARNHFGDLIYIYICIYICIYTISIYIMGFPLSPGVARRQIANGGDGLQIWRVAANILNNQSRISYKGWSSSLGVGHGATNYSS